jgi:hypothetical protein
MSICKGCDGEIESGREAVDGDCYVWHPECADEAKVEIVSPSDLRWRVITARWGL